MRTYHREGVWGLGWGRPRVTAGAAVEATSSQASGMYGCGAVRRCRLRPDYLFTAADSGAADPV